jgi:hypothetical protein
MPRVAIILYLLITPADLENTKQDMTDMLDHGWTVMIAMPKTRDTLLVFWQKL